VAGERVGAEQRALGDGTDEVGVRGRQREGHRCRAGQRAAGGTGRAAQHLVVVAGVLADRGLAQAGQDEHRGAELLAGRQLDDLVGLAAHAEPGQHGHHLAAQAAGERTAVGQLGTVGAACHPHHERVGLDALEVLVGQADRG